MALVTLAIAYTHIKGDWGLAASPPDARDAELQTKLDHASDIILSYLKVATSPPFYDATTAPPRVQAAALLLIGHLWEHRGDDMGGSTMSGEPDAATWQAIERLLIRDRDPALA